MAGLFRWAVSLLVQARKEGVEEDIIEVSEGELEKEEQAVIQGLVNVGNSCFLNSVVQSLASLDSFIEYIEFLRKISPTSAIVKSLMMTLSEILHPTTHPVIPNITRNPTVRLHFLSDHEQNDAAEFFTYLFEWIEDEMNNHRNYHHDLSNSILMDFLPKANTGGPTGSGEGGGSGSSSGSGSGSQETRGLMLDRRIPEMRKDGVFEEKTTSLITTKNGELGKKETTISTTSKDRHSLFTSNPFCGLLESTVRCDVCGYTSTSYSEFLELTVPIYWPGMKSTPLSIRQCFDKYTEAEPVTWKCEECAHSHQNDQWQTPSTKQLTIARHPKLLCVHFQRLMGDDFATRKIETPVHFGTEFDALPFSSFKKGIFSPSAPPRTITSDILSSLPDISSLPKPNKPYPASSHASLDFNFHSILYSLVAVIVHMGSATGGHYIVYKRILEQKGSKRQLRPDWVMVSDESWRPVSEAHVLKQKACMLFYEKIQ